MTEEHAAVLGSTILDVAIGIVFVFLLVSLLASAMREGLETVLKTRASHLEAGLREVLRDPDGTGLVQQFYNHPLIYSLYSGEYEANPGLKSGGLSITRGRNLPSYIPSSSFALALMDMAARGPQTTAADTTGPVTLESIRANLGTIQNATVERALLVALDHAGTDLQQLQLNLEAWYNSAMDRVSGWYKRSSQIILLLLGLVVAVALNINSIHIGQTLFQDRTARDLVVSTARAAASAGPLNYGEASARLGDLDSLIGWKQGIAAELREHWPSDVSGWLLTAFAVSFGAPFWFDLLNRLIVVRSTVKPHQKSPEESSVDRQTSAGPDPVPAPPPLTPAPLTLAPPPAGLPGPPQPPPGPDGCEVDMTADITTDEMLPAAQGGVR